MTAPAQKTRESIRTRDRNTIAAVLSLIPGLGHIYKGHKGLGVLLLLGWPLAVWVGVLLSLATLGSGLLIPILYWGFVAVDAYNESDRRKHHLMDVF